MNITTTIYTLECYGNGEARDFIHGQEVKAAPGHHYYSEFESLEDAQDAMCGIRRHFFLRDGGEYDEILADAGEDEGAITAATERAKAALADFEKNGVIDDDSNYYGIRAWEVFAISRDEAAHILANDENPYYDELIAAMDRLDVNIIPIDEAEMAERGEEDPKAAAADKNYELLGAQIENARQFIEVC